MTRRARCVVLISGSGTNLQAMIDVAHAQQLGGDIVAVISNNASAPGLERARLAGIAAHVLDHREFADRAAYDTALQALIDSVDPDLVVLAGFMRILTPAFVTHFSGRLINIHPSLLPAFKGLDTHARALAAGVAEHGCSVHFVTAELDGGPVIAQARVTIEPGDTPDTLAARVHRQEHHLYPQCVRWFLEGRLTLGADGHAYLDHHRCGEGFCP